MDHGQYQHTPHSVGQFSNPHVLPSEPRVVIPCATGPLMQKLVLDPYHAASHEQNAPDLSYDEPQTAYDHSNSYNVDFAPRANPCDQQADQSSSSYIHSDTPSTAQPQTSHLTYADSGPDATPYNQYTNQLSHINTQGIMHHQGVHYSGYMDSGLHTNRHDQYINQPPIEHSQSTHHSTYPDSGPYTNTHIQVTDQSNISNIFPHPEQLMPVPHAISHPPYHGFDHNYSDGSTYYYAPDPEISCEQPVPPPHARDWAHGLFDVCETGDQVEGGHSVSPQPARNQHNFNRLRYHRTLNRHTPYTTSNRHDSYLIPHNIEHREGPSNSAPQSVLPLVPDAQPVTPVVPPPAPTVLSPVPDTLQSVSSTFIPVIFRVSKLPKVTSGALFRMKCTIFINCFFADADTVQKMAQSSMNAEISNDGKLLKFSAWELSPMTWSVVELVAWSKTKDGRLEVDKLCKVLGTIKKNIQFLSRSAVLWGYDLHNALMMKHAKEVKKIINCLVKDKRFIFGVIDASHCFPFFVSLLMLVSSGRRHASDRHLRKYDNPILCSTAPLS